MSLIAGLDYSTRAVDVVLLEEDSDRARWVRCPLEGLGAQDAFERVRNIRAAFHRDGIHGLWDDVLAIGIEEPRGYNSGALYRVQGAILACLPRSVLVQPWVPSAWRRAVGLPGNAPKLAVADFVLYRRLPPGKQWPQDACDAYCIALATRRALRKEEAA